jgi:hypothetical protein
MQAVRANACAGRMGVSVSRGPDFGESWRSGNGQISLGGRVTKDLGQLLYYKLTRYLGTARGMPYRLTVSKSRVDIHVELGRGVRSEP